MTSRSPDLVLCEGSPSFVLRQYRVGSAKNFAYLLVDSASKQAFLVDPAWQPLELLDESAAQGVRLSGVLLTHTHADHMGGVLRRRSLPGVGELFEKMRLPIYVHHREADRVVRFCGVNPESVRPLSDSDTVPLGSSELVCLHTPGHSPGSACYLADGRLISGDTLFVRNIGNVEHTQGDIDAMYHSLCRLAALPTETKIYPGHDYGDAPSSTIGLELRQNAYMRPMQLEQFRILMGRL